MSRPPSAAGRRPGTGTGQLRPPTAMRPGTASRLAHAMAATPGTGRPGTRGSTGAMGTSLNTEIQVMDRPTTQQGLGGIKTGYKGPHRQIQDKSYFLGLMRSKINELGTEINRLQNETDRLQQENSQFLLYEKKAEVLAQEIKDMQGELIDHNTLVDKLNTDMSVNMVQDDYNHLKQQNDREAKSIDMIFTERQEKEKKQQELEKEMEQERQLADTLVAHMDEDTRRRHLEMKSRNNDQLAELERQQRQLDEMNARRADLEDEISVSHIKQEAVTLYEKLHELGKKRDSLVGEAQSRGTPQEERERLLKQVKEDNQEIASMERQIGDHRERSRVTAAELQDLETELDEQHGERNVKYRELRKREETMDEFMTGFEDERTGEMERKLQLEINILALLEQMARNLSKLGHVPSRDQLTELRADLTFKETEMRKSETTSMTLGDERAKLDQDLVKVEQLEDKISAELQQLQQRIDTMTEELQVYDNLDALKEGAEERKKLLEETSVSLGQKLGGLKEEVNQLSQGYVQRRTQLEDNETYLQLQNLEKKWQHYEQNNYVMKEFIGNKMRETDYSVVKHSVLEQLQRYNKHIIDNAGKPGKAMSTMS